MYVDMSSIFPTSVLRLLFIFTRSVRSVGRRQDTAERCLVFVLVSRRASNLSNKERIQNMSPNETMGLKKHQWHALVTVYYR